MDFTRVSALEFVFLNHDDDLLATLNPDLQGKTGEGIKFDSTPAVYVKSALAVPAPAVSVSIRAPRRAALAVG